MISEKRASVANIHFEDLCILLKNLGFEERIRGSNRIFRKEGIIEKITKIFGNRKYFRKILVWNYNLQEQQDKNYFGT